MVAKTSIAPGQFYIMNQAFPPLNRGVYRIIYYRSLILGFFLVSLSELTV